MHRLQLLWPEGSRAQAQWSRCTGFVTPMHVGSSLARERTCVPCIARRPLNHWPPGKPQDAKAFYFWFLPFGSYVSFICQSNLLLYFIFQKSTEEALKAQSAEVIRSAAPPQEKKRKVEKVSIITSLNFSTVPWIAVWFPEADPADWGRISIVHYTHRPPLFPSGLGPAWHSETSQAYIGRAGFLCFYRCLWVILAHVPWLWEKTVSLLHYTEGQDPRDTTLWGHQIFDLIF